MTPNPNGEPDNAAADKIFKEKAAATWSDGQWKEMGGGGTVWDSIIYDPKTDFVLVGTGNGSPWNHRLRSGGKGDNLFLTSIVALKPDTGEYVWHYQTVPSESWDYTSVRTRSCRPIPSTWSHHRSISPRPWPQPATPARAIASHARTATSVTALAASIFQKCRAHR